MKTKFFFLLAGLLFILQSCSGPSVPLIERNEDVKEYIETLEALIDEYADLVENIAEESVEMQEKEDAGEDPSFMDGLEFLGEVVESGTKIYSLAKKIEGMEDKKNEFEKNLSAADYTEFLDLYTNTMKRFFDLTKRLEELDKK